MKEKIKEVLKNYVAPVLLNEATDAVLAVVDLDTEDWERIDDNTPNGTHFTIDGKKYMTTRSHKNRCEISIDRSCMTCPFNTECTRFEFGFVKC